MDNFQKYTGETSFSLRKDAKSILQSFALGMAACFIVLSVTSQTSMIESNGEQQLWLNQPKSQFLWNQTKKLDWSSASYFTNIAVSPFGELYGIQTYAQEGKVYQLAYKFNFQNGLWTTWDKDVYLKDIKFDKLGNFYILDIQDQVYAKNSKSKVVLTNIKEFEVNANGEIIAISKNVLQSSSSQLLNVWTESNGQRYKLFSSDSFSTLAVSNNVPIYVDVSQKTIGYGNQCVREVTTGVDSSLWALHCNKDESGNSELLKFDQTVQQWYKVSGVKGVKVGAYNEISVVVLDAQGKIYFSSDSGSYQQAEYLPKGESTNSNFNGSSILDKDGIAFVQSLISQDYAVATLCFRGSVDGFVSSTFHQKCNNKGATIMIAKSTQGKVFGGYTAASWKSIGNYVQDNTAYLFSVDQKTKLPNIAGNGYSIYDNDAYGPTYGGGHDLHITTQGNGNTNSYSNLGHSYTPPNGIVYTTEQAKNYLTGSYNWMVKDYEVYYLI